MSAKITVTRSPELRGRHGSYDVAINNNHVGALARGESLTHEVAAGEHTVQATRDDKHTSPRHKVTLADEEHLTLYASLISERADYVRSPTKPSDYIILTTDGSLSNGDGTAKTPRETQARLALIVVGFVALAINIASPPGVVKQVSYVVWIASALIGFVLAVRLMRHLYRSPRGDGPAE
jgi:hypothetical protein